MMLWVKSLNYYMFFKNFILSFSFLLYMKTYLSYNKLYGIMQIKKKDFNLRNFFAFHLFLKRIKNKHTGVAQFPHFICNLKLNTQM